MEASLFVTKREKLCKARYRGIITDGQFKVQAHLLFIEAQVSKGFDDDAEKADEIFYSWRDNLEREIEETVAV